jgi:hypothetical protein
MMSRSDRLRGCTIPGNLDQVTIPVMGRRSQHSMDAAALDLDTEHLQRSTAVAIPDQATSDQQLRTGNKRVHHLQEFLHHTRPLHFTTRTTITSLPVYTTRHWATSTGGTNSGQLRTIRDYSHSSTCSRFMASLNRCTPDHRALKDRDRRLSLSLYRFQIKTQMTMVDPSLSTSCQPIKARRCAQ